MGPPRSRKGIHTAKKKFNRKYVLATKHRARDIDQVYDDLAKRQRLAGDDDAAAAEPKQFDEDLPGGGLYYCVETARHFMSQDALDKHKASKQFKKRVKELLNDPVYNQDAAEAARGMSKEKLPSLRSSDAAMGSS